MSISIKLVSPLGSLVDTGYVYSTGEPNATFIFRYEGVFDPTKDVVTITHDGVTYSSALNDMDFNAETKTISFPNLSTYPDGIFLVGGLNYFKLLSTNSDEGTRYDYDFNLVYSLPSLLESPEVPQGIYVNRLSDSVEVIFVHSDPTVSYYNIFASTTSGGGLTGYTQINYLPVDPLSYGFYEQAVTPIASDLVQETSALDGALSSLYFVQGENTESPETLQLYNDFLPADINRIRVTSSIYSVGLTQFVKFRHYRTGNRNTSPPTVQIGEFAALPNDLPLYYVAKAYRVVNDTEVESGYSAEVSGLPIFIPNTLATIPQVSRNKLVENTIATVYRAQPDLSVQPGSVIRDVFIDPVVSEMERIRFILDFTYRASSFPTLIQIDDPKGLGISTPVSSSSYKQALKTALFLVTDDEVQVLIDSSFDRLASNFGVTRNTGSFATGEVVFYTKRAPSYSLIIPSGTTVYSGSVGFKTTQYAEIPLSEIASYYDPTNTRYAVRVPVRAITAGTSGNVTTGQITRGAPLGLFVTNETPTFGGKDFESNQSLSSRAFSAIASIDKGTRAGYERVSRSLPGVEASFVVDAGSPYMIRDNGLGGKVDIWVRGTSNAVVTDNIAPAYTVHRGTSFTQIDGAGSYRFRVDSDLTLVEMLDYADLNLGLRLASGEKFILTGYTLSDNVITLDPEAFYQVEDQTFYQPDYTAEDIILGDWRSDLDRTIVLSRQPVSSISTVKIGGVPTTSYLFYSDADPLDIGGSSKSTDRVKITDQTLGGYNIVSNELHTLIGLYSDLLNYLGVDPFSIVVKSLDSLTTYKGPFTSAPDYNIENDGDKVFIKRTVDSTIPDGGQVYVSYNYVQNISISYTTNLVVANTQVEIDKTKHLIADVLVKETLPIPVNIKAVVIVNKGVSSTTVDTLVRTSLTNLINGLGLGASLRISDVISTIDNQVGVSYVRMPLVEMSIAPNTLILRESITTEQLGVDYIKINSLSSARISVWMLTSPLEFTTKIKGGSGGKVFKDGVEMTMLNEGSNPLLYAEGTCFILDGAGLTVNAVAIANSAYRVLVALKTGDDPSEHNFKVNYRVDKSEGLVKDIVISDLAYFSVGSFSFTYEEDIK